MKLVVVLSGLVAVLAGTVAIDSMAGFPHEQHERVFPTCTACHIGIEAGEPDDYYPDPTQCRNCHDGETEQEVDWQRPDERISNVHFDHVDHRDRAMAEADSTDCLACHQGPGGTRMSVAGPQPELCIGCHEHDASQHMALDARCVDCHIPLTETRFNLGDVSKFPQAPEHLEPDFVVRHADYTDVNPGSCSVCHSYESCTACHPNGGSVRAIASLARDRRVARLLRESQPTAHYPEPGSHQSTSWEWRHGPEARDDVFSCSNCHTQSSCSACHRDVEVAEVVALPVAGEAGGQGVSSPDPEPIIHVAGFRETHGSIVASGAESCEACHELPTFCDACHTGPSQTLFHFDNYRERHSADAYAGAADCQSCHNPDAFCRDCHVGAGLASGGRLNVAFHTAEPFWLLGHAQAARQGLEGCRSCHAQRDCTRCHSVVGAWRINPHGPGFDGTREQSRNRLACLQCHRTEP